MKRKTKLFKNKENLKKTSISEAAAIAEFERKENMFTLGSYISADWASRLYSEYLKMKTEDGITEKDMLILKDTYNPDTGEFNYFPLNTELVCLLLRDSYVQCGYSYSSIRVIKRGLVRAQLILMGTSPNSDPVFRSSTKAQMLSLRKMAGEDNKMAVPLERIPMVHHVISRITENLDVNLMINLRDKTLILVDFILGQRCDTLQHVLVSDISMELVNGELWISWAVRKEKAQWLPSPRVRSISPHTDKDFCPNYHTVLWLIKRGLMAARSYEEVLEGNLRFSEEDMSEYPMFCSVRNNIIKNKTPLQSRGIANIFSKRGQEVGYGKGVITGHSARKGTSTKWMDSDRLQSPNGQSTQLEYYKELGDQYSSFVDIENLSVNIDNSDSDSLKQRKRRKLVSTLTSLESFVSKEDAIKCGAVDDPNPDVEDELGWNPPAVIAVGLDGTGNETRQKRKRRKKRKRNKA
eukprot:TRINITY_DN1062_c0_g1_i1.p1 TRINITY_DN1062_c0_g1~~TRINITY_DN1062_c0_g1_i1.p1  ORF type:complete len:465 (-),score=76.21 TRINITY_DN1062_c0_g1_i1:8-1402(-)